MLRTDYLSSARFLNTDTAHISAYWRGRQGGARLAGKCRGCGKTVEAAARREVRAEAGDRSC